MPDITELTCRHCKTGNRVPSQRLADQPKCGRCHKPLFVGLPIDFDAATFELFLTKNKLPLLIDFWASWCAPCVNMAPAFAEAAKSLEPRIMLGKVNTETQGTLATRFGIRSLPTIILFADGQEIARHSGALGSPAISRWAKSHLPNLDYS